MGTHYDPVHNIWIKDTPAPPSPSTTPSFDTVSLYIEYLQGKILAATFSWHAFGEGCSTAYSKAYNDQGTVLSNIKRDLLDLRDKQKKILTFGLTLLTAGIAGPIATVEAKALFEVGEKKIQEAAAGLIQKGADGVAEWAKGALEPPSFDEAFKPAGIPPDQYGNQLRKAIDLHASILEQQIVNFMKNGSAGMSLDGAKRLSDAILTTDYIKNPPQLTNEHDLKDYAKLVLWLAWAWARDLPYWQEHSDPSGYLAELRRFEALRKVLEDELHIDGVTQTYTPMRRQSRNVPKPPFLQRDADYEYVPSGPEEDLIDMAAFIKWSMSRDARTTLFAGMPAHPLGRKYVETQMEVHKMHAALHRMALIPDDD